MFMFSHLENDYNMQAYLATVEVINIDIVDKLYNFNIITKML